MDIDTIHWPGMYYRHDIGHRGLAGRVGDSTWDRAKVFPTLLCKHPETAWPSAQVPHAGWKAKVLPKCRHTE